MGSADDDTGFTTIIDEYWVVHICICTHVNEDTTTKDY